MIVSVVTMTSQGHCRPFFLLTPVLETALEVITDIVAMGELVISVELMEGQRRTPLPAEAFDGKPIAPYIQQLEADWKAVLHQPVNQLASLYQMLTDSTDLLWASYQSRSNRLELAICQLEWRIEQAHQRVFRESYYVRLEEQLTQYQQQLAQVQAEQRRLCARFAAYLDSE